MAKRKTKDNIIELAEHQVVDGNELRDLIREKAPLIRDKMLEWLDDSHCSLEFKKEVLETLLDRGWGPIADPVAFNDGDGSNGNVNIIIGGNDSKA
jgi:hypothetical protein